MLMIVRKIKNIKVDDILELVRIRMFFTKSLKVNEIHESLPKACELNIYVLLNRLYFWLKVVELIIIYTLTT